jgi:hypothetical protein
MNQWNAELAGSFRPEPGGEDVDLFETVPGMAAGDESCTVNDGVDVVETGPRIRVFHYAGDRSSSPFGDGLGSRLVAHEGGDRKRSGAKLIENVEAQQPGSAGQENHKLIYGFRD